MMKYLSRIVFSKIVFKIILFCCASFFLASCNTVTIGNEPQAVGKLRDYKKELVKGGDFWITTFQKITDVNKPFVFYIESDGPAFNGKYRVSNNPTPRKHMLIQLAAIDSRPNIIYIARPCQYTPMNLNPKCDISYWTDRRLSEDSVESINQVINTINKGQKFSLVGYSGGGGIAILVAARNPMVKNIITIAGNLDHAAFTSFHNVTPMMRSLNPINFVKQVSHIPQLHLSGGDDKIVPPLIADKFVRAANSKCIKQKIYEGVRHHKGWHDIWEYITSEPLLCY